MVSKKIQRLVEELRKVRKEPGPDAEKQARELSFRIAQQILKKKILNKALQHPPEIKKLIHPQDTSRHPVLH